jgi:nicotinate phosphoribosyltransferase
MNENCLLIVDPQVDFFPGGALGVTDGNEIIDPVNKMIERAVKSGWNIIVTGDQHPNLDTSHSKRWGRHCVKGTMGAMFHKDIRIPSTAYILSKGMGADNDAYSAFDEEAEVDGTPLELFLRMLGVRNLYVCGLATDWCVKETVFHALEKKFKVNLVTDAIRAVNLVPNAGLQSIMEMASAGVTTITTQDAPLPPSKDRTIDRLIEETMDSPIIQSVLDDDFYKYTMGLFITAEGLNRNEIGWGFKNRTTSVPLAKYVSESEFRNEIEHFRSLRLTDGDMAYMRSIPIYGKLRELHIYIGELSRNNITEINFKTTEDGQLNISWKNKWIPSQRFEIPVLRIVNGLYYRTLLRNMNSSERKNVFETGMKNLNKDIELLKKNRATKIVEFGNRRSFSGPWHRFVTTELHNHLGNQLLGTSKVSLAKELGIAPKGTIAHEMSMVLSALTFDETEESLKNAFVKLHEDWLKLFGKDLSIILTDTFGTAKCLEWLPKELVAKYSGMRIDSKNPDEAIPELMNYYKELPMVPAGRLIMPSDGLSIRDCIDLTNVFGSDAVLAYGVGTNLTNNMGLKQLSIVAKTYSANSKYCVKLSDNIAKATGDPKTVELYKKALGYVETYNHEQVV